MEVYVSSIRTRAFGRYIEGGCCTGVAVKRGSTVYVRKYMCTSTSYRSCSLPVLVNKHTKQPFNGVHLQLVYDNMGEIIAYYFIAWAIKRSAQRRLARQREEELRLATRYSNSGDMGLQKNRFVSSLILLAARS